MSPDVWMILAFAGLLIAGVPVAFSLALSGAVGIVLGLSPDMLATLGTNTYNSIAKYPLIAIPLFILTGLIFERSGVALRLVRFAQALIGPRHGGLALVAVLVCMIMGGMSGFESESVPEEDKEVRSQSLFAIQAAAPRTLAGNAWGGPPSPSGQEEEGSVRSGGGGPPTNPWMGRSTVAVGARTVAVVHKL